MVGTMKWFTDLPPLVHICVLAGLMQGTYSLLDKAIDVLGRCN
jgi:hypothetical protein